MLDSAFKCLRRCTYPDERARRGAVASSLREHADAVAQHAGNPRESAEVLDQGLPHHENHGEGNADKRHDH